jgi:hypothetical protein
LGSFLALFALAFQLAISFGHVHLDHKAPLSSSAIALANALPSGNQANTPSGRDDLGDNLCPICTLMHLASVIVPADTPPLPLPNTFGGLQLKTAVACDLTASQGALFQARAPPVA